jgi:hypothetical protein
MTSWRSRFAATMVASAVFTRGEGEASAHHSFAMFDFTKVVTFKATVKEFHWTNPHVLLWFTPEVKDGETKTVWWAELTSPGNLTRVGWSKRSFKPDEPILVEVHPLRDGTQGGAFKQATLLDTGEVLTSNLREQEKSGLK